LHFSVIFRVLFRRSFIFFGEEAVDMFSLEEMQILIFWRQFFERTKAPEDN